jgi:hypothetical protein
MTQLNEAQPGSLEEITSFENVAVYSPGILGSFDVVATLQLPAGLDLHDQWQAYRACNGRVLVSSGQGVLDHKTVPFDKWLVSQHSNKGVKSLGIQSLTSPDEKLPVVEHEGQILKYFVPNTEEPSPQLH